MTAFADTGFSTSAFSPSAFDFGSGPTPPTPPTTSSTDAGCCLRVTASDIIRGALRYINVYASGESLAASDAEDALETLNDLLDSFSTDEASVYAATEETFAFTAGQYRYTIGNYCAGQFAGTVTSGSPVITSATIPSDMIVNGDLRGTGIAAGTYIVSIDTTLGTITMSANATTTPGPQQIDYTIPGDFKTTRPLRIVQAFTRIQTSGTSGLDYPIEITSRERYNEIGYKGISAPWPVAVWYNPTMPLGELYFYQNPSGSGELHLFISTILRTICNITDHIVLPKGYVRWLKWALAKELATEYGKSWTQQHQNNWKEARDLVKALNKVPTVVSRYDDFLVNPRRDAGWILYGGFR